MDRRTFLVTAAAGSALAASPTALARPPLLEGEARRRSPSLVDLDWRPHAGVASVRMSADPDAAAGAMRLVDAGVRGGRLAAPAPVAPRPYFLVTTRDGASLRLAERLLPLQGGRNFRDLGGYRAADGRRVRWGRIYRSGVMSGLTAADMAYLADLDVRVICDLRSIGERRSQPNPFIARGGPSVVATDYEMMSFADLHGATTREGAIRAFAEAYVAFTQALAPQYADIFARLAKGEAPLAVNCSAGKDRTGIASALILSVLGVPRATVVADYALTQVYTPVVLPATQALAAIPPAARQIMGGSDPAVMRLALEMIDRRFGGPVGLAKTRMGLTDAKIARLRQLYLA
jgi:protein-tyrosine phosphatase